MNKYGLSGEELNKIRKEQNLNSEKKNVNMVLIPLSASPGEALKAIKKHLGIDEEKSGEETQHQKKQEEKRLIWKEWWFWVIVVLVVFISFAFLNELILYISSQIILWLLYALGLLSIILIIDWKDDGLFSGFKKFIGKFTDKKFKKRDMLMIGIFLLIISIVLVFCFQRLLESGKIGIIIERRDYDEQEYYRDFPIGL